MHRSFLISWVAHGLAVLILLLLGLVPPPSRARKPTIQVRLLQAPPPPEPEPPKPRPTLKPTPRPREPVEKPKPTPAEPKKPKQAKEIVKAEAEIVEATPEPTESPPPSPTPLATPPPSPTSTPYRTPEPTASPTPRPRRAIVRQTPAPTPVPPRVEPGMIPAVPKPPGPIRASEELAELGPAYNQLALFNIQQHFKPPRARPGTTCVVRFRIMKDGEIQNPEIVRSTGRNDLDQSALRALRDTARLPPLYDFVQKRFLEVQVTFDFQKRR